jgi:hypothetical protein
MAEAGSSAGTRKGPGKTQKTQQGTQKGTQKDARRGRDWAGLFTQWSTWGVLGAALLGAVIVWRLWGSTYRSDVRTICNAEKGSGFTIQKDMPKVTQWIRANLETPEGNTFFSTLTDTRLSERAKRLQTESAAVKLTACPMVSSYQALFAEGEYRADLGNLCSSLTFPTLAQLDDDGRLAKIEEWIDRQAKSPRTKELADPLRSAASPAARAKLLRDTASNMNVFTCDTAKTLDSPQAPSKPGGSPMVRVWSEPQVIGPLKEEDLAKAMADVTPAMNECYRKGLEKRPELAGKVSIKMQIDTEGKVTKVAPADLAFDDHDTLGCLIGAAKEAKLPKNQGPIVSALVPLELTTRP